MLHMHNQMQFRVGNILFLLPIMIIDGFVFILHISNKTMVAMIYCFRMRIALTEILKQFHIDSPYTFDFVTVRERLIMQIKTVEAANCFAFVKICRNKDKIIHISMSQPVYVSRQKFSNQMFN